MRNSYYFHLNEIFSTLKNEYTDWERPSQNPLSVRDATLDVLSDGHTVAPLIRIGYLHSLSDGKTFFLHFQHHSGERDLPLVSIYISIKFLTDLFNSLYYSFRFFKSLKKIINQ